MLYLTPKYWQIDSSRYDIHHYTSYPNYDKFTCTDFKGHIVYIILYNSFKVVVVKSSQNRTGIKYNIYSVN